METQNETVKAIEFTINVKGVPVTEVAANVASATKEAATNATTASVEAAKAVVEKSGGFFKGARQLLSEVIAPKEEDAPTEIKGEVIPEAEIKQEEVVPPTPTELMTDDAMMRFVLDNKDFTKSLIVAEQDQLK